jgi:hypothetical protein
MSNKIGRALKAGILTLIVCSTVVAATIFICPMMGIDYVLDEARRGQLPDIADRLQWYKREKGTYPSQEQGLRVLKGEYIREVPIDPWGSEYVYRVKPNGDFVLYSRGKNKLDENGLGDDVVIGPKTYKCEEYGVNCFKPCEFIRMLAFFAALASLGATVLLTIAWLFRRGNRNSA